MRFKNFICRSTFRLNYSAQLRSSTRENNLRKKSRSVQSDGRKLPANPPPISYATTKKCGRPHLENTSRTVSQFGYCWSPGLADRIDGESPIRSSDPVLNTLRRHRKNSKAQSIGQRRWRHTIRSRYFLNKAEQKHPVS